MEEANKGPRACLGGLEIVIDRVRGYPGASAPGNLQGQVTNRP
jgi:hypothetical protein